MKKSIGCIIYACIIIAMPFLQQKSYAEINDAAKPYTVNKVTANDNWHYTRYISDGSGNLTKEYYQINIDPTKISTSGNISWQEVSVNGENTIAVQLPNNKIKYFKYTIVNPANIVNTTSYTSTAASGADYVGVNGAALINNVNHSNINADFVNNSGVDSSAIVNVDRTIDNIKASFIGNSTEKFGGAIHSYGYSDQNSYIKSIKGVFINNTADIAGSAIRNSWYSNIDEIEGTFINNTGGRGVITNEGGHIGSIKGDFIKNDGSQISNEANTSSIGKIEGNFIKNDGRAITNENYSTIGNITGNFIGNTAVGPTIESVSPGGAIYNYNGIIGNIAGDFIDNSSDYNGGAIANMGTVGDITGNFIGNSSEHFGGAIYNGHLSFITPTEIGNISANFIGNHANSNVDAQGGAIWTANDLTLVSDNKVNTIKNNYTMSNGVRDDNAIYVGNSDAKITFKQTNSGEQFVYDNIRGVDGYKIDIIGDGTGVHHMFNDMYGANVYFNNTNINTINGVTHDYSFNKFTVGSDTNMSVDVDLANKSIDRISADNYGEHQGKINIIGMNLISHAQQNETSVKFADEGLVNNVTTTVNTIDTPVFKYDVSYRIKEDEENLGHNAGYFHFNRHENKQNSGSYNPAVLSAPAIYQAGIKTNIDTSIHYSFYNTDMFSMMPMLYRTAKMNENKLAFASTEFDSNRSYSPQNLFSSNSGVWFKPYTTFERIPLKNGPKVNAITYGGIIGYDSDFKHHKKDWHSVNTYYLGYNGAQLDYNGVDSSLNGGLLGFTKSWYKNNFWTALSTDVGASNTETSNMYGKENSTSLFAAIASKTGYNFEIKDGRYIIQPNVLLSYSFINTFDYTNSAKLKIKTDPLHTIQINPGVKFIANFENGWQPYATVGMVWNILNNTDVSAGTYKLPSMHIKPYVEYGVGIQKTIADSNTGFLQAVVRNGGRNGVAISFGFRAKIGEKTTSKANKHVIKK